VLPARGAEASGTPADYVKADYQVKLAQNSEAPTAKDMSEEEAAEKGAQNLWKLFAVALDGKTIEMSYHAASARQPRAEWEGTVTIDESQSYWFTVDAVTDEYRTTGQLKYWDADLDLGMDKSLLANHAEYETLAKAAAEKYQLVPGRISSVEYVSQGYTSNHFGKNPDIAMLVKAENGQQAQVRFSRYNKELLAVEYDGWLEDAKILEEQAMKEAQDAAGKVWLITGGDGEDIKLVPLDER
jgi:hypothetical protein